MAVSFFAPPTIAPEDKLISPAARFFAHALQVFGTRPLKKSSVSIERGFLLFPFATEAKEAERR
jgi:hypothetical protein